MHKRKQRARLRAFAQAAGLVDLGPNAALVSRGPLAGPSARDGHEFTDTVSGDPNAVTGAYPGARVYITSSPAYEEFLKIEGRVIAGGLYGTGPRILMVKGTPGFYTIQGSQGSGGLR